MMWKGTKAKLMTFMKELNEKHQTINFDIQISPRKIAFLDTVFFVVVVFFHLAFYDPVLYIDER